MPRIYIYEANANPVVDRWNYRLGKTEFARRFATGEFVMVGPNSAQEVAPPTKTKINRSHAGTITSARAIAICAPTRGAAGVCEVCGFSRVIEKAHIVPARFGGPTASYNMLELCPNHHTLFDRNELTRGEMQAIWPKVSAAINMRSTDPMLQEWRTSIATKYGLSLLPS